MVAKTNGNPYNPGTGTKPPYLAGREKEKGKIQSALDHISGQPDKQGRLDGVRPPLLLIGPRGVGKTALIGWTIRKAGDMGVRYALLSEELLDGPVDALGEAIMGEKSYAQATRESKISGSAGPRDIIKAGGEITYPSATLSLRPIINRQLKKGPLLLVLDETHEVNPELLKRFSIAVQEYVLEDRPLALLLAGAPGLDVMLQEINATFMERARKLPLNLLRMDETREALSVPASEAGVPMDKDALEALASWTDCYPYFIQLAGEEAWETAKRRGGKEFTVDDAKKALSVSEQNRLDFYHGRLRTLYSKGLEQYALQTIDLIETGPDKSITYIKLIDGIQKANIGMKRDEAVTKVQLLFNSGLIHEVKRRVVAGIPSLFDYVKGQITA